MSIKKNNVFIYTLENKVVFPYHQYTFTLSSSIYDPEQYNNLIGFVTKIDDVKDYKYIDRIDNLSRYGSLLKIHKSEIAGYRVNDRTKIYSLSFLGLTFARFRISTLSKSQGKLLANIEIFQDQISRQLQVTLQKKQLISNLKKQMKILYECKLKHNEAQIKKQILQQQKSTNKILFKCIAELELPLYQKLKFLQMNIHDEKIEFLLNNLTQKTQNIKSVIDLQQKVRQDMTQYLNNKKNRQISISNTIRKFNTNNNDLQDSINSAKLPDYVRKQIDKQMKKMGGQSQAAVAQKYIETLLEIPWMQSTQEVKDIKIAEKILNQDHAGLDEVKQRILEYLAVTFRNGNTKGNIICLHGPPGVGKTSVAKSIARTLGRHFTRISLGGMNDEAQLRGHRRTYIASLPGAIIRALIKAKSNNPVILLDEIQKIGKSYKGDPEHALLQILDPSQNNSFVDHYVGIPVDLSKVMFICTANSLQMSTPLLNRLELIEISGYTREEKLQIAKNYLLPQVIKQNGVTDLIEFQTLAIEETIKHSKEMGVRQLQRNLSKICRKIARNGKKQIITEKKVEKFLGARHKSELWDGIGVVNGMAWSPLGGKVLIVEAVQYIGIKPKIEATGQLGQVMKQSINIALSWIKAHEADFKLWLGSNQAGMEYSNKSEEPDKISLHLHFPQGATKKDGPSAGVAILTCIMSLLLKIPVRSNLSMTGEITLSGRVLPVGGIREKCIAAIYQGIKHIIIPAGNTKDLQKIDNNLKKQVNFYTVNTIREALTVAFPTIISKHASKL